MRERTARHRGRHAGGLHKSKTPGGGSTKTAQARAKAREDIVSTQRDHGTELVPRPERTPDAVRVALDRIAPHRLDEMEKHKEEPLAAAIRTSKNRARRGCPAACATGTHGGYKCTAQMVWSTTTPPLL